MPNAMFGAPIGISAAEADVRAQQLHELSMDKGQVELEQAQLQLSAQKQMLDLMKGLGGPQPPAGVSLPGEAVQQFAGDQTEYLASTMDALSTMALKSGLPEQAKDYAVSGSALRKNASEIQTAKINQSLKELNLIGSLMDNVHDEASWRQANAMYQMETGKPTPYARMPYNPQVVSELRDGISTAKDKALTAAAKAREQASQAAAKESEARVPLIRAQADLARQRTDNLRKAGATAKIPKASDVRAITDLLTKDYGMAIEDARVLARPVAERMLDIMKQQNLSQSQAAAKAYQEAKAAGDFGGIRPRIQMSGSADRPLDLPPDKTKLKTNMYYKGKGAYAGKVLLWTGTAFVPVGKGPGEIEPSDDDNDSGEEPDDDKDEGEKDPEGVARGDYQEAQ